MGFFVVGEKVTRSALFHEAGGRSSMRLPACTNSRSSSPYGVRYDRLLVPMLMDTNDVQTMAMPTTKLSSAAARIIQMHNLGVADGLPGVTN